MQPNSRLIHVGSHAGMEQYHALLLVRVRELQLKNVVFAGAVTQDMLNAYYQVAHVFLSMSEHEGFCIPLLEAMVHDVPVVAYAAGAVPETLGGAGVLVRDKPFDLLAETLGRVAEDEALLGQDDDDDRRYQAEDAGNPVFDHLGGSIANLLAILP